MLSLIVVNCCLNFHDEKLFFWSRREGRSKAQSDWSTVIGAASDARTGTLAVATRANSTKTTLGLITATIASASSSIMVRRSSSKATCLIRSLKISEPDLSNFATARACSLSRLRKMRRSLCGVIKAAQVTRESGFANVVTVAREN